MKKLLSLIISLFMITAFFSSCSDSKQTKTDTVKTEAAKTDTAKSGDMQVKSGASGADSLAINAINSQVKGFAIDGFPGGSSKLSKNEDLEKMKRIVGIVKPIIDQIPAGYIMQITGHAANYESKAKQKRVSTERAAKVYNELKKAGVAAAKMSYKGVGVDEPLEGIDGKDAKQRSVSFKAVKK